MNKKILAAAIGAAMVAPLAAHADIKVSGRVAADIVSLASDPSNLGSGITFGDWGQSRLQFDGSSDSGLYARAALDTRGMFFGGAPTSSRDIYIGYKGSWGSLQAGRMAGAVKNLEGDPFIATFLELRNNAYLGSAEIGGWGSSGFINNMIQYANKFGDTSIKIQYDPIDDTTAAGIGGSGGSGFNYNGGLAASLKAKLAGANVWVGYNNMANTGASYYKLGGDMTFSGIKVKLGYQNYDSGTGFTFNNFVIGGEMNLGSGQLIDLTYTDKSNYYGPFVSNAYYRIAYMKKMGNGGDFHAGYVYNGGNATSAGITNYNQGMFGVGVTVKF